ncbi:MAG: hypothetical protein QW548_02750 [Candidatus Aenigmatarchaeota archaeon]
MSLINRGIYLAALIVVAAFYTVTLPPESLSIWSFLKAMIPATSVSVLFLLAKGVLGEGLTTHIGALMLVVAVVALVSIGLSATGLVAGAKSVVGTVGSIASMANGTLSGIVP